MHAEGFRSLRLVTAAYHMPRSRIEFHAALPDAEDRAILEATLRVLPVPPA